MLDGGSLLPQVIVVLEPKADATVDVSVVEGSEAYVHAAFRAAGEGDAAFLPNAELVPGMAFSKVFA